MRDDGQSSQADPADVTSSALATAEAASGASGADVTPSMIALIEGARSAADFTSEYNDAVQTLEESLLGEALQAWERALDIGAAVEKLSRLGDLKRQYRSLLDEAAREPGHPMAESLSELRDEATLMDGMCGSLLAIGEAFLQFAAGKGDVALRMLDETRVVTDVSEADSFIALQIRQAAEGITALIRRGALDYAGAQAAFDRSVEVHQQMLDIFSAEDPDSEPTPAEVASIKAVRSSQRTQQAWSLRMQYHQGLESCDYPRTIEAEPCSARAYLEAASSNDVSPVQAAVDRAHSCEALAEAAMAEASMLLDDGSLDAAAELISTVHDHYQAAAAAWLKSGVASASLMQEHCLNAGAGWKVRFSRELERERSHVAMVAELQDELSAATRELAAARNALSRAADELPLSGTDRIAQLQSENAQLQEIITSLEPRVERLEKLAGTDGQPGGAEAPEP